MVKCEVLWLCAWGWGDQLAVIGDRARVDGTAWGGR